MPFQTPSGSLRTLTRISQTRLFTTSPKTLAPPPREQQSPVSRLANIKQNSSNNNNTARNNSSPTRGIDAAARLSKYQADADTATQRRNNQIEKTAQQEKARQFLRQLPRRWAAGDVYAPNDLGPVEMKKWKKRGARNGDVVDALNLRPLDMYKNFSLVRAFMSSSGQIQHSKITKLRPVNQRKIAKMIRRVQGMGLYPTIHAHPEQLREEFYGGLQNAHTSNFH